MAKIVFEPPKRDAPGYLRRAMRVLAFQQATEAGAMTLDVMTDFVEMLLDFVKSPARDKARELLLDASEEELQTMLEAVRPDVSATPLPENAPE